MKDAKSQLKRIMAQWIGGKNDWYCLVLKDHMEMVKLPLLKKEQKCLQDERERRPTICIYTTWR